MNIATSRAFLALEMRRRREPRRRPASRCCARHAGTANPGNERSMLPPPVTRLVSLAANAGERLVTPLGLAVDEIGLQRRTLADVEHRPWPLPTQPWLMGQTWYHLLFAHWPGDRPAPPATAACTPPRRQRLARHHAVRRRCTPSARHRPAPVGFLVPRAQRSHLRRGRRQAGHLFLQPGRRAPHRRGGGTAQLPAAVLPSAHARPGERH